MGLRRSRWTTLSLKTPSQSFTRKISRLIEAVAIFMDSVDWHASPARDDVIGEVSDSVAKPLKLSISISASISSDGG